jgi:hypothetical protein
VYRNHSNIATKFGCWLTTMQGIMYTGNPTGAGTLFGTATGVTPIPTGDFLLRRQDGSVFPVPAGVFPAGVCPVKENVDVNVEENAAVVTEYTKPTVVLARRETTTTSAKLPSSTDDFVYDVYEESTTTLGIEATSTADSAISTITHLSTSTSTGASTSSGIGSHSRYHPSGTGSHGTSALPSASSSPHDEMPPVSSGSGCTIVAAAGKGTITTFALVVVGVAALVV